MQHYAYSDFGSFQNDPKFINCLQRVMEKANPSNLLAHPPFQLSRVADIAPLHELADKIKQDYKHLVILGMGGAILNPRMVTCLYPPHRPDAVDIIYCDHIDSFIINHLAATLDLEHTAFLIISKSGDTIETMALFGTWYGYLQKLFVSDLAKRFYIITSPHNNPLRLLGERIGAHLLEHDPEISGRYASFTNITVLPGLIAGMDMQAFCQGGTNVLTQLLNAPEHSHIIRGAATLLYMLEHNTTQSVTMPYLEALKYFVEWQAQILAESLGKKGYGLTPIKAMGPLDQHSQLQLYLDGPRDKFFTILYSKAPTHSTPPIKLGPLSGHTLQDVCNAEYNALVSTLQDYELPHRIINLQNINEASLGALVMHSMLEVALCGLTLGIDPFNQPAVESIKAHIRSGISDHA